uniref:Uncharacterized protein n=1 Tax=Alexandrium andersonii TaxID=327968 RepID=A0A7S2JBN8_9DINO|mmetsp:Transcript_9763/g.22255  ORF Transcript_9763/g.22255 Transcript_9763/m.22255 type:complete len:172 (+) Transcript_9763:97-612(+)
MAVFACGFDFDTPKERILSHFEQVGAVSELQVVGRAAALVFFVDPGSALLATMILNETFLPGHRRYMTVRLESDHACRQRSGYMGTHARLEDSARFSGELQTGTVIKFVSDRGFGYIAPDSEEPDVFVHFSAIQGSGFRELQEGQRVSFGVEPDPKGKGKGSVRAVAVSIL